MRKSRRSRRDFQNGPMAGSRYKFCDVCDRSTRYHLANFSSAGCSDPAMNPIDIDDWPAWNFREGSIRSIWNTCWSCRVDKSSRKREDSRRDNDRFLKGDYTFVCIEAETWERTAKTKKFKAFDHLTIKRGQFYQEI